MADNPTPSQPPYDPYRNPHYGPPHAHPYLATHLQAPPAKPRRKRLGIVLAVVAALVVLTGVFAVIGSGVGRSPAASGGPGTSATGRPAAAASSPVAEERITIPNVVGMTGNQAQEALSTAGARNVNFPQNTFGPGIPLTQPITAQSPAAGTQQSPGEPVILTLQQLPPPPPRAISSREWAVIAKSPDAHKGERLIVFGKVTQFDSVTGPASFRANVDGERKKRDYDYDVNTILQGDGATLADIVADDLFRAEVTVTGSYSYTTTMGGTLTVPLLQVDSISRL